MSGFAEMASASEGKATTVLQAVGEAGRSGDNGSGRGVSASAAEMSGFAEMSSASEAKGMTVLQAVGEAGRSGDNGSGGGVSASAAEMSGFAEMASASEAKEAAESGTEVNGNLEERGSPPVSRIARVPLNGAESLTTAVLTGSAEPPKRRVVPHETVTPSSVITATAEPATGSDVMKASELEADGGSLRDFASVRVRTACGHSSVTHAVRAYAAVVEFR
jgi:hypothetical protein